MQRIACHSTRCSLAHAVNSVSREPSRSEHQRRSPSQRSCWRRPNCFCRVTNAVRHAYAPPGREIEVRYELSASHLRVEVSFPKCHRQAGVVRAAPTIQAKARPNRPCSGRSPPTRRPPSLPTASASPAYQTIVGSLRGPCAIMSQRRPGSLPETPHPRRPTREQVCTYSIVRAIARRSAGLFSLR